MSALKAIGHGARMPELLREETLASIFTATVRDHGHRTALIDDAGALTYVELDAQARRMARR